MIDWNIRTRPGFLLRPRCLRVRPERVCRRQAEGKPGRACKVKAPGRDISFAKRRLVQTGLSDDRMVEITSGLKKGEKVVTVGQFRLSDGDAVKIVPEPEAGQAGN